MKVYGMDMIFTNLGVSPFASEDTRRKVDDLVTRLLEGMPAAPRSAKISPTLTAFAPVDTAHLSTSRRTVEGKMEELKRSLAEHKRLLERSSGEIVEMLPKASSASVNDLPGTSISGTGKDLKKGSEDLDGLHGEVKKKRQDEIVASRSLSSEIGLLATEAMQKARSQGASPALKQQLTNAIAAFGHSRNWQEMVTRNVEGSQFGTFHSEMILADIKGAAGDVADDKKDKDISKAGAALLERLRKLQGIVDDSDYKIASAQNQQRMAQDRVRSTGL